MSDIRGLFEAELDAHGIIWCQGNRYRSPAEDDEWGVFDAEWIESPCDDRRSRGGKHSPSGGAWATERPGGVPEIHLGREVATRYGLQMALHEVGHIVLGHTARTAKGYRRGRARKLRSFEIEAEAEAWSFQRMHDLGVPVPEKARQRAAEYVAYRKRRGDRVIARQTAMKRQRVRRRSHNPARRASDGEPGGAVGAGRAGDD